MLSRDAQASPPAPIRPWRGLGASLAVASGADRKRPAQLRLTGLSFKRFCTLYAAVGPAVVDKTPRQGNWRMMAPNRRAATPSATKRTQVAQLRTVFRQTAGAVQRRPSLQVRMAVGGGHAQTPSGACKQNSGPWARTGDNLTRPKRVNVGWRSPWRTVDGEKRVSG